MAHLIDRHLIERANAAVLLSMVWAARFRSIMRRRRLARAKWTICSGESITGFIPKSLLKYSAMPRCCRFFVSPRREEDAYPQRSVTDEQRRRGEKAAQPGGRHV